MQHEHESGRTARMFLSSLDTNAHATGTPARLLSMACGSDSNGNVNRNRLRWQRSRQRTRIVSSLNEVWLMLCVLSTMMRSSCANAL